MTMGAGSWRIALGKHFGTLGGKMASGTGSLETEVLIFLSAAPLLWSLLHGQAIYMSGKVQERRRSFLTCAGKRDYTE